MSEATGSSSSDPPPPSPSSSSLRSQTVAELGEEYDRLNTELLVLSRRHTDLVAQAESMWKRMVAEHAEVQKSASRVWDEMKTVKARRHDTMARINSIISGAKEPKTKKKKAKSSLSGLRARADSLTTY